MIEISSWKNLVAFEPALLQNVIYSWSKGYELFVMIFRAANIRIKIAIYMLKRDFTKSVRCSVSCFSSNDVTCCVTTSFRFGSKHGQLETLNTRSTLFYFCGVLLNSNEFDAFDVMSVQQCLACNAVVSRPCVVNLSLFVHFSVPFVCEYMWFSCLAKTTEFIALWNDVFRNLAASQPKCYSLRWL